MSTDILEALKIEIPIMEALETDDMPVTLDSTLFQTQMGHSLPFAQTYSTLQAVVTATPQLKSTPVGMRSAFLGCLLGITIGW